MINCSKYVRINEGVKAKPAHQAIFSIFFFLFYLVTASKKVIWVSRKVDDCYYTFLAGVLLPHWTDYKLNCIGSDSHHFSTLDESRSHSRRHTTKHIPIPINANETSFLRSEFFRYPLRIQCRLCHG